MELEARRKEEEVVDERPRRLAVEPAAVDAGVAVEPTDRGCRGEREKGGRLETEHHEDAARHGEREHPCLTGDLTQIRATVPVVPEAPTRRAPEIEPAIAEPAEHPITTGEDGQGTDVPRTGRAVEPDRQPPLDVVEEPPVEPEEGRLLEQDPGHDAVVVAEELERRAVDVHDHEEDGILDDPHVAPDRPPSPGGVEVVHEEGEHDIGHQLEDEAEEGEVGDDGGRDRALAVLEGPVPEDEGGERETEAEHRLSWGIQNYTTTEPTSRVDGKTTNYVIILLTRRTRRKPGFVI